MTDTQTKRIFICATGTDIGKTYVSCLLLQALRRQGHAVHALKPIISGYDDAQMADCDSGQLLLAMDCSPNAGTIAHISPWRFQAALSPDMAAKREGREINFDEVVQFCRTAGNSTPPQQKQQQQDEAVPAPASRPAICLIEGVGGIMVPIDRQHTMLDLQIALDIPCLLIAGTYLGTLSHSLTALATLAARNITPLALILNTSPESPVPASETAHSIHHYHPDLPIFIIDRNSHENAQPVDAALIRLLTG